VTVNGRYVVSSSSTPRTPRSCPCSRCSASPGVPERRHPVRRHLASVRRRAFKLLPGGWDRGRQITVVRHEGYFPPRPPLPRRRAHALPRQLHEPALQVHDRRAGHLRDFLSPDLLKFQAIRAGSPTASTSSTSRSPARDEHGDGSVRQHRAPARDRLGARSRAAHPRPRGEPAPGKPPCAAAVEGTTRR